MKGLWKVARSLVSTSDNSRDVPSLYSSAFHYELVLLQPVPRVLRCLRLCDALRGTRSVPEPHPLPTAVLGWLQSWVWGVSSHSGVRQLPPLPLRLPHSWPFCLLVFSWATIPQGGESSGWLSSGHRGSWPQRSRAVFIPHGREGPLQPKALAPPGRAGGSGGSRWDPWAGRGSG